LASPVVSVILPRFVARWIWAWVRIVGVGILLTLGFCAVMFSV